MQSKNYKLKRIKRLMRVASIIRKRKGCTKSGDSNYEENILDRDFTTRSPNNKWVTDVTYLEYGLGQKAYLSAVKDLYDGYIVSFEIGKHNDDPLVMRTLEKTFKTLERDDDLLFTVHIKRICPSNFEIRSTSKYVTRS